MDSQILFVSCQHENFIIIYKSNIQTKSDEEKTEKKQIIKFALEVMNVCGTKTRI